MIIIIIQMKRKKWRTRETEEFSTNRFIIPTTKVKSFVMRVMKRLLLSYSVDWCHPRGRPTNFLALARLEHVPDSSMATGLVDADAISLPSEVVLVESHHAARLLNILHPASSVRLCPQHDGELLRHRHVVNGRDFERDGAMPVVMNVASKTPANTLLLRLARSGST